MNPPADRSLFAAIALNIFNYLTLGNADFALRVIMGILAAVASIFAALYYRESWRKLKRERTEKDLEKKLAVQQK